MNYTIGVDGGGTKTECIAVDPSGQIVARHAGPGCNPSIVGAVQAAAAATDALRALRAQLSPEGRLPPRLTLLCMAGSPAFWREYSATLSDFGQVRTFADSLPVLELATQGGPGLALHAGTGSFVTARTLDGSVHYAGGLGWRFGDACSGYDIGRRVIARALLEEQGWVPKSLLTDAVREHTGLANGAEIKRCFYDDPSSTLQIAALAPAVLNLAQEGDPAAKSIVIESAGKFFELARDVAVRLFPEGSFESLKAGLSGPILNHPFVRNALSFRAPFPLTPIEAPPTEGLRQMLVRMQAGSA
jgi:glucosamine kinase